MVISMVMRYLDLEDSGSGIRSGRLILFCRLLTITSFRSPCIVLQFLPACPSQPLSPLAFCQSLIYSLTCSLDEKVHSYILYNIIHAAVSTTV